LLELDGVALAAVDRQDMEAGQIFGVALQRFGNLDGQFARRGQNQCLRLGQFDVDLFHQGQGEGSGFAGAGLRLTDQVAALKQDGNTFCLDR
jgi:hypothetical protein